MNDELLILWLTSAGALNLFWRVRCCDFIAGACFMSAIWTAVVV